MDAEDGSPLGAAGTLLLLLVGHHGAELAGNVVPAHQKVRSIIAMTIRPVDAEAGRHICLTSAHRRDILCLSEMERLLLFN